MSYDDIMYSTKLENIECQFWAWLAGFWEGEGSVDVHRLTICQKNISPLKLIRKRIVGSLYFKNATSPKRFGGSIWIWQLTQQRRIFFVLEKMFPFLIFRDVEARKIMDELQERFSTNTYRTSEFAKDFIRENYHQMDDKELGKLLGKSKSTIGKIRINLGCRKKPHKNYRRINWEAVKTDYLSGMGYLRIAKKHGTSDGAIRYIIRRMQIERRSREEALRIWKEQGCPRGF